MIKTIHNCCNQNIDNEPQSDTFETKQIKFLHILNIHQLSKTSQKLDLTINQALKNWAKK
jgi:hypothetical protein